METDAEGLVLYCFENGVFHCCCYYYYYYC